MKSPNCGAYCRTGLIWVINVIYNLRVYYIQDKTLLDLGLYYTYIRTKRYYI